MKYGFILPPSASFDIVNFAQEAEQTGWDGLFSAHGMWCTDTMICLTAAALHTKRIRLGTMLTPLSCVRPWKLAAEAATLDRFSNGRVTLTVGMGAPDTGFAAYGEETDLRTRADLVDEGLNIMGSLWSGKSFKYEGKHYTVDLTHHDVCVPKPVQSRIPVWAVGAWPRPKSMGRVLRCDGVVPVVKHKGQSGRAATPDEVNQMKVWIAERRTETTPFDIVIEGMTVGESLSKISSMMRSWIDAGATWWIESLWGIKSSETWWERMRQGPPQV